MLESILDFLGRNPPGMWTGPILAGIALVETVFPPFPGDVLFIVCSSWARLGGGSPVLITLAGFAGCFAGTAVLFHIGRRSGTGLKRGILSRWVDPGDIARAEGMFHRQGPLILVASRFIPGVRSLLVLVAGSSGMGTARALTASGISALVWYGLLSAVAMAIGDNVDKAKAFMSLYGTWVWIALGLAVLLYIGIRIFRRGRDRTT